MKHNLRKRIVSLFLTLTMALSLFPVGVLAAGVPEPLVSTLAQLYDGDEERARADLEALYAAGLLDDDGKLVTLDIREDGECVELSALAERISNAETVGAITVNGNAATPEQIVLISQVKAALEIAELLDEEIDVTDEHVENLESLLNGIQDGSVDLENSLRTGSLRLQSANTPTALLGSSSLPETLSMSDVVFNNNETFREMREPGSTVENTLRSLELNESRNGYFIPYISGDVYDAHHEFKFVDDTVGSRYYYYTDSAFTVSNSGTLDKDTGRNAFIDWDHVKIGTDGTPCEQTITIVLPLKTEGDADHQKQLKNWVANESAACTESGKGITMSLPDYGEKEIKYYMTSMYFSSNYKGNNSKIARYPVYVVTDSSENPLALAARYATTNIFDYVRKDTVNLYMKSGDIEGPEGFAWNSAPTDELGYRRYEGKEWPVVAGVSFEYYVTPAARFNFHTYITRSSGSWEKVQKNFIKLKNPEDSDFPYVAPYCEDSEEEEHPERQYDVEIAITRDLYNAFVRGWFYLESDEDLRYKIVLSNRRKAYTFQDAEDFILPSLRGCTLRAAGPMEYEIIPLSTASGFYVDLTIFNGTNRVNREYHSYGTLSENICILFGGATWDEEGEIIDEWGDYEIKDVSGPFLRIPGMSRIRETLAGLNTDVIFTTNISGRFNVELYTISEIDENNLDTLPANATKIKSYSFNNPGSHITIPGSDLNSEGNYAVKITTQQNAKTAVAFIRVKQGPAKVTLDKLDAYAVVKDENGNVPAITYTLTSAVEGAEVKYTVQPSGSETVTGDTLPAQSGTIPFTPGEFEGLKKAYTITVYARNKAEDPWSTDSMLLTVYNANPLKLILKDVPFGELGGTTGGAGTEAGSSLVMDNSGRIKESLATSGAGNGYQVNYDGIDFETFRHDVNLQEVISVNYGSGAWGILTDKMNWAATEGTGDNAAASDRVTLNYEQSGAYRDIRSYSYTSYIPTSDFLIVATDSVSADAPVQVTATHAGTGLRASVNVTVNTLKDKLYLFRFNPKAVTEVVYTNGNDVQRSLKTNANGELAVYEPAGIKSDVVATSKTADVTYIGTVLNRDLVSGEQNIAKLELYPCNNLKLVPISNTTLTFLKPDGTPYVGKVILRGGVYNGGSYCADAKLRASDATDAARYLRTDMEVNTDANGKATVWFDPTEFGELTANIRYVFEYRPGSGYQPGYVIVNPLGSTNAESVVNLKPLRGSAAAPQITRQEYQQYLNGGRPTSYTRNVIDSVENIGISPNFPKAVLYTDVALPGETVDTDGNGYSTYTGADVVKFAFYKTDGETKLTGQTDLTGESVSAAQITNLSQLDRATYFVFPFSAVPMLRSTYTMTNGDLTADGITDQGDNRTPTARVKAVFTRGSMTVADISMPFGVTNVSHQPDLSSSTEGATAIGREVRGELRGTTDIGAIFRSINVNDMIRKGFVFLGSLSGAGGDNPINMMILPTQDPATFRIIAFVGANQRQKDDDGDGVSVNFNAQDLAEDMSKLKKELEESNKKKDSSSNGEGSMQFNFYGTIILEARAGVADGKWDIAFRGGNVGTNVKGKYEWGQTFMCGPFPAFVSFEVGFHADLEVAFGNKGAARAMLLDAALGVSIEAFAGLGFDLSIVAIQLGIYGQIGADVNFLLLTPSDTSNLDGTKLTISGEIGLKLKIKLLLFSYTSKFASTGFNWTKKWNDYDQIKKYWTDQGYGELFGVTESGRAYAMYLFADGSAMVAIEDGPELESRDYLELSERAWTGGAASGRRLMRSASPITNAITDVQTNAYPYSHPAFTDDGELFLYVSDNNAQNVESVASYAVKSGEGYENKGRVDTSEGNVLTDMDVVAGGTKDNAFAAWVKQVEIPKRANKNADYTNDELGMMFNATEIYAGSYNGTAWTTTRLTDNYVADMSPTVASCGNKAVVAWRSMSASKMPADVNPRDITAMFDVENNVNYRIYNGKAWTDAQVAYNGSAGTVNAIDSAMLSDGTAILVYTVRTGEDVTSTETFYTVINASGAVVTTGRLTNDSYTDTNAQVTAVNDKDGGYFVLGWYSEHDAGEGTTAAEYDANGNVTATKAVVAHDIRLARINANGSYDIDFPESIGGSGETGVSSDFRFSAPVGNMKLENVSVVWSQRKDSEAADDAGKYELNAVRFFQAEGVTGLTAPADIAVTDKNYTIDRFDTYTDGDGAIHAIILGSDYSSIQGISVYDSIDLNAAAGNTVTNNDNSPSNLDILDGTAISSLKLATGTFPTTAADVTAEINISEVIPGFTTPVQFTVTNTGTGKLGTVTAQVGAQSKNFTVNLLPNQSATLLMTYNVPAGAVSDVNYTVKSGDMELGSGTLTLNRPDVGISGIKLLQEHDGVRDIQLTLSNGSAIPLAGSGKTVKLAFYKDPFHESMIGDEISIPTTALAEIDAGTYTTVRTLNVTDIGALNAAGEIPDEGLTVYARAWVENVDEPDIYNNDSFLSFKGLLTRSGGEKITVDTTLEGNESGGYTVQADIRNNSMQDTDVGNLAALLLDDGGNVIAQKSFRDEALSLTKERSSSLFVTFAAVDLNGKTPAKAIVGTAYTVSFDLNGGSSDPAIEPVQTDLAGHIALPATQPTPPTGKFFSGWYTQATGGEQVTPETVFTENTTVYARYAEHRHSFAYSKDGTTITATCSANDCYLADHKATLTIAAPEGEIVYTGSAIPAVITDANAIQGDAKVRYATKGEGESYGEASETVPVNAGTYKASITLGSGDNMVTAEVEYTIRKATLTNVSVTQDGTLTYTGETQTPRVNTAATAVNGQSVTFTYSLTADGDYGTMPTFTNVADSRTVYYKASAPNHEDATGSFTVTMNKADQIAPAAPTKASATVDSITLAAVDGYEYRMGTDGTWQDSPIFTGLTMNTPYTFYQRLKEDANHNASSASEPATISTSSHAHEWGYAAGTGENANTITATCANSDGRHGTPLSAALTIVAPEHTVYGDGKSAEATITGSIGGVSNPAIVYKKGNETLTSAPTEVGTYTASITLGEATASVTYSIAKANLSPTVNITGWNYGATPNSPSVDGNSGSGAVTYTYKVKNAGDDTYSATVPAQAGSYTVRAEVAESDNYNAGTTTADFTIAPKPLTAPEVKVADLTYTGKALTPAVTVKDGDTTLAAGTDYTVRCGEVKNAGSYTAAVTFTGNYSGTADQGFEVARATLKSSHVVVSIDQLTYTGSEINPDVVARFNGEALKKGEDKDYTVAYSGARTNAGDEVTVTVTGQGNFTGEVSKSYSITARSVADATITVRGEYKPTGSAIVPEDSALSVTVNGRTLTKGTDFDVSYANNVHSGEATVTVTGKGNYFGTATGTFEISGYNVFTDVAVKDESGKVLTEAYTKEYDGNQHWITVSAAQSAIVTYSTSENGTYTVSPPRFTHVKLDDNGVPAATTVYYKLSADGYKTESGQVDVTITPATATLTWSNTTLGYNGLAQAPTATVGGLIEGDSCDAIITGAATATGSYTATVAANGLTNKDYKLDKASTQEFTIAAQSLADATVIISPSSQPYTGNLIEPRIIVKNGGVTLTAGTDYTIAYSNNQAVGTASITVTGGGNYTGSKDATFTITKAVYPYALTVNLSGSTVIYSESLPTVTVTQTGENTITKNENPNIYFSTSPSGTGTVWNGSATLPVGTYYIWAEVPATDNYSARQSERTSFQVTKATPAVPTGVLTDTTGSYEMAVTIPAGHSYTDYEYKVGSGSTYSPLPKLTDGKFTPAGTSAGTTHTVYIRLKADANHNASDAASATLTTPTLKKLTLDTQAGMKWTVTADAEGKVTMPSNPVRAGYTFQGWNTSENGSGTSYAGEAISNDTTVYAQWEPNTYSVAYHANAEDASGNMENKSFVYGVEPVMLTSNGFTRTGYTFCGWATAPTATHVVYADQQAVSNLTSADGGVVDLYAVWVRSAFKVSGSVVEEIEGAAAHSAVSGVTVRLMRGDSQIGESAITDASGAYSFSGVPSGTYNIVATRTVENGEQTVTALVTVGGEDTTAAQVTLPAPNINSVLEVASDAPAVMVGGLNELAKDHAEADKDITVTMTVEKKEETAADDATRQAVEEIKNSVDSERTELDYLEIKVEKEVMQNGTKLTEESGTLSQTSRVMEIIVPFKTSHRSNFSVYRNHEGKAAGLNKLSARPGSGFTDGTFFVDLANALVYIYANQFSTYAVGYEENYNVTVNNGSGSGDYAEGATVTITAGAAPSGKTFDQWTSDDGVAFANASSATTTFTMPAKDVTVTATYKASGGSGGGAGAAQPTVNKTANGTFSIAPEKAKSGEKVTITAKPNEGYEVDAVTVTDANGKAVSVTKVNDTTYTFTQPSGKVKVDVTFKAASKTDTLARFVDVSASDWYADAVRWALENGVMDGVSPKYFNPNGQTTRAMVATMLWRLEGSPVVNFAMDFADVETDTWYTEAVRWAASAGIISGYKIPAEATPWPMGFDPDKAVTREQLATMLYRYAQYKKQSASANAGLDSYGDAASVSDWATGAMQWATGSGVISGTQKGTRVVVLDPQGSATRAQVATMLMRYSTNEAK